MLSILKSGEFLVFLGAVFWSLNAPLVKGLGIDSFFICGMRSLIAGIALAGFIRPKRLNWSPWMLLYLCSYCGLCISIVLALSKTSSAVAVGMQYTAVVWLFLVKVGKTKKIYWNEAFPIGVILAGILFFMCSGGDQTSKIGNLIALTEGIFFAFMTKSAQKSAGTNPLGLTALANLFTGICVFLLFPNSLGAVTALSGAQWKMLLILGVVQVGAGYGFYNMGVQKIAGYQASIIALWEVILGPVWTALFLKEYPNPLILIGFSIMTAGIFLDVLKSRNRQLAIK